MKGKVKIRNPKSEGICNGTGVQPSSGAATCENEKSTSNFSPLEVADVAAPKDGGTPAQVRLGCSCSPRGFALTATLQHSMTPPSNGGAR
jgi:hypothetical protein